MSNRSQRLSRRSLAVVTVLLVVFAAQAVLSMRHKSVTVDEVTYIAAGYYHLRTGRFDFNMTHPPLMKVIPALPLLTLDLTLTSVQGGTSSFDGSELRQAAHSFLFNNRVDADTILFVARLPIVVLGIGLGLMVFVWACRLYGERGAVLALLLYVFSPNVLAHTRLATNDLGLSLFVVMAAYLFWRHVREPTLPRLLGCGLAFSAAILSKGTAIFLVPIAAIYAALLIARGDGLGVWPRLPLVFRIQPDWIRLRQLIFFIGTFISIGALALVMVNAAYLFEGTMQPLSAYGKVENLQEKLSLGHWISGFTEIPLPLPAEFMKMLKYQLFSVTLDRPIYFNGEIFKGGAWHIMPLALLIKTPVPFLVLLAIAGYQLARARHVTEGEALILLTSGVLLAIFIYLKTVSIGLRYLLPLLPLLHVFAGRVLRNGVVMKPLAGIGLAALVAWYAVGTLRVYPHYLAYFNETVGGPRNGYRFLVDSYLDWGQDLKGLKRYMEVHRIERIRLAYFGAGDANLYGIDYDLLPSIGLPPRDPTERRRYSTAQGDLPPFTVEGGPIAISATLLAGISYPGYYAALRELEPVGNVGYSILIYRPDDPRE